ncbi:hypothetical protein LINPERHAP1_LOCUS10312 [Linum perenne]
MILLYLDLQLFQKQEPFIRYFKDIAMFPDRQSMHLNLPFSSLQILQI